jgi:NO-binding membrane sensor protein with MHYT domain/CheY-like chemotaxis protein
LTIEVSLSYQSLRSALPITYNLTLVLASIVVAVLASFTAFHLSSRISVTRSKGASLAWLVGGAMSMGMGIWSMHFVGMLGSSIGIPMTYEIWWTLLSLMIAVTVSGFALFLVRKEGLSWISLVIGSAIMGGGIASMHYTGMMALQISPVIRFELFRVVVSVLIAVLASFTALSLFVALRSSTIKHPFIKRAASALVMGFAIAGMHYTGMAAAEFASGSICTVPTGNMSNVWLASTIAVFTLLILAISLITALYDAHLMGRDLLNERLRLESQQLDRANQQISQQSENLKILNLELEDRVLRRTEQLKEADRRKDEFLAMLAHELRNPLAPISAAAELLQVAPDDEKRVRKFSEIIARQVRHMTCLIDDLMDVSRVTQGLVELEQELLDVRRIASDALEQVRPFIDAKRHRLAVHLSPNAAFVLGDHERLVQVVSNVLNNAAKYTAEGGNIALRTEVHGDQVSIVVSDNGIGMTAELMARAFDLFAQAERTADRSQGGLGIGLAIVKNLVELHRGQITLSSKGVGQGSEFKVCLPRVASKPELSPAPPEGLLLVPERSLRLMVVDDNVDAASVLCMWLESAGYEVMLEHSSAKALERACIELPDVCLLDIGMPGMDGNELARRLRARLQTPHNAILIAISGYGQQQDRKRSADAGFDHHFVKPVDTAALAALLTKLATSQASTVM